MSEILSQSEIESLLRHLKNSMSDETPNVKADNTNLNIPSSVTKIGRGAYSDYDSLTSVNIPNSVTSIEEHAFLRCTGLASINIPDSVASIEDCAFLGCTKLEAIDVAVGNTEYSSIDGILYDKNQTTLISCPEGKSGTVSIPNSVTSIGENAFIGCAGLTRIDIPDSVTSIAYFVFSACTKLEAIDVAAGNTEYSSIDGILYDKNQTTLICCPEGKTGTVNIPNNVTSIEYDAFFQCIGLTNINIPSSVTRIEYGAFIYCAGLTSIIIPNSVTSIGVNAFCDCTGLTSINIPDSVTNIGALAFISCTGLASIKIGANVNIDIYAFPGNFKNYYDNNNRDAGTYTRISGDNEEWVRN